MPLTSAASLSNHACGTEPPLAPYRESWPLNHGATSATSAPLEYEALRNDNWFPHPHRHQRMTDNTTGDEGEAGMDVSGLRRSATDRSLDRDDLDADPFRQFEGWFESACQLDRNDPNAMSLSTVDEQGRPYARTVLLKSFDERGFVFYTNYESRKARHIEANPEAALLFFWSELGQQVGVRGAIEKLSTAESLRYFASRPRGSQLGAWVSPQSSVITNRSLLKNKVEELRRKFENRDVPLPSFWGGYRLAPREIEFWQGREDRLHDRFLYTREGSDWHIARLAP